MHRKIGCGTKSSYGFAGNDMTGFMDRMTRLWGIARGLIAVRRAQGEDDRSRAKAALAELFSDARGATMKIGQLFSEVGGDTPFDQLAKGVEPYPFEQMRPVLEGGLGCAWQDVFAHIDETAIAASLGQVHRAVLKDATEVAVKIRYPHIADAVATEMRIAGLIPGVGPAKKWGIDIDGYKRAIKDNMTRELDYRTEAARQMEFRKTTPVLGLCVPKVFPDLCSEAVLVQSWETGVYLDEVLDWPEGDRKHVAHTLLSTLFYCLFVTGRVHGDPHLGNTFYRQTEKGGAEMVLLDYGCTIEVSQRQREALLDLILACRDGGSVPVYDCLVDMGFNGAKLDYIKGELTAVWRLLLKPFVEDAPFRAGSWGLKDGFIRLLGERRWWLRSAGPPESLLTVRVLHGAIDQMESLNVAVSWWETLQTALSPAMLEAAAQRLESRRKDMMDDATEKEDRPALARELRVLVTEGRKMVVSITMPGGAAYDLPEIMPAEVVDFIATSDQIDLDEVLNRVVETKAAPQILFELDRGVRHYKVWLV